MPKYCEYYKSRCVKTNNEFDKNFYDFLNEIERRVKKELHIDLIDLPDDEYRLMFDDGYDSTYVAQKVIKEYCALYGAI